MFAAFMQGLRRDSMRYAPPVKALLPQHNTRQRFTLDRDEVEAYAQQMVRNISNNLVTDNVSVYGVRVYSVDQLVIRLNNLLVAVNSEMRVTFN